MCRHWNTVSRMANFKKFLYSHSGVLPTTRAWYPVETALLHFILLCFKAVLSNTHLSLVLGNFNDLSPQRSPHRPSCLSRVLMSFGLQHLICEPTRRGNILDWLLRNKPEVISNSDVLPPLTSLDHCSIFAEVNYNISLPTERKSWIWDCSNPDIEGLNGVPFSVPWASITANSTDVNSALQNIADFINQNAEAFIPTKPSHQKRKPDPWMTRNILLLLRKRHRLF